MTTPRVTVPVEQLENWRNDLSLHGVGDIQTAVEMDAMLSAAPAPEGGAVTGPGGYLVKDFAGGWYWTPNAALDHASGAPVWSVADGRYETDPPALAAREEAPAEAGGAIKRLTKLAEMNGSCPGWIVVNQNDLRVALSALRAHPQAPTASFMAKAKNLLDLAEKAEEEALDGDEGCVWPVEALRAAYDDLAQPPARSGEGQ